MAEGDEETAAGAAGAMVEVDTEGHATLSKYPFLQDSRTFIPWCFETLRLFMTMSIFKMCVDDGKSVQLANAFDASDGESDQLVHALDELPNAESFEAQGAIMARFDIATVDKTQLRSITRSVREYNKNLRGKGRVTFISDTIGSRISNTAIWQLYLALEEACEDVTGQASAVEDDDRAYEILKERLDYITKQPTAPFKNLQKIIVGWGCMMLNLFTQILIFVKGVDTFVKAIITGKSAIDIINDDLTENMDELWGRLEQILKMIEQSSDVRDKDELSALYTELRNEYQKTSREREGNRAVVSPAPSVSLKNFAWASMKIFGPLVATAAAVAAYAATHAGGKYRKSRRQRARPTKRRARSLAKKRASQRKRRATKMKKKMKKKKSRKGRR